MIIYADINKMRNMCSNNTDCIINNHNNNIQTIYFFFCFQHRNALKAEGSGVALRIRFTDITAETLTEKLNKLLDDKRYYENAREVARVFRDTPIHPMDTAMFYIEYVMRHKGAKYLKSAAVELYWYQHLLLDVFALLLGIILFLIVFIFVCVKALQKVMRKNVVEKAKRS